MTKKQEKGDRSVQHTVASTVSSGSTFANDFSTATGRAVWTGRIAFIFMLAAVATTFGYLSYTLLTESEHELTEAQFASIADRAIYSAKENIEKKRLGTVSLASVIGGANPDAAQWPFVTLNNYETIATNLIDVSKGCQMIFAPFVQPDELQDFEDFAYDYYENSRMPEPFPNGTAVSEAWGKGVWSMDSEMQPYKETDGTTFWGSSNQVIAPMFQHSLGPSKQLLMNMHFSPKLGKMIDEMKICIEEKASEGRSLDECVAISAMAPDQTSGTQKAPNGPGSNIMQPVYASNDPTKQVGVIVTAVVWTEIMVSTYADAVSGVDVVLQSGDQAYTFTVYHGSATLQGEGDLHDTKFDSFATTLDLTSKDLFNPASMHYTVTLYPTQELYDVYCTRNPMLATVGAVCIIALTSMLFLLYDLFVRRDINARKELLEAKRKFVRFVSHEVRTPLNSVTMGLTLMKDEMAASLNKGKKSDSKQELQGWLTLSEDVTANALSAVDVLNDFLNYDKVETGKLSLEHSIVPIFDLIDQTVSEFKFPAMKKKINMVVESSLSKDIKGKKLDVSQERYVVGDKVRLTQVFRNLVSNAIKFTPEQGDITVRAIWVPPTEKELKKRVVDSFVLPGNGKCDFTRAGSIMLTVTDSGAGMTPEQVKIVFKQGTQFNVNELQAGNGSGLGTYIAKGIVRQHGGALSASSDGLNKGSSFSVSLPVYSIPQDLTPTIKTVSGSFSEEEFSGPMKILVVDDSKMNLKLLMRLLSKHGHICEGAENGQIAIDKATEAMETGEDFDVILMDYQMPVMDGPTASMKIREVGCDAFIVGVTGNVMPEDVRFFKDAGANAVLPKPLKLPDLDALFVEHDVRGEPVDSSNFEMSFSQLEDPLPIRPHKTNIARVDASGEVVSNFNV